MTDYTRRKEANDSDVIAHLPPQKPLKTPDFSLCNSTQREREPFPHFWKMTWGGTECPLGPRHAPSCLLQKFTMSGQSQDTTLFWLLIFSSFKFKSSSLYPNFKFFGGFFVCLFVSGFFFFLFLLLRVVLSDLGSRLKRLKNIPLTFMVHLGLCWKQNHMHTHTNFSPTGH